MPPPASRCIDTDADIRAGVKALRRRCAVARRMHDATGDPPLRRRAAGLEGLARIVVGQQVSVASADAIWSRFAVAATTITGERLLTLSDEEMRGAGLSRPKIRTLRAVGSAISAGLDLEGLSDRSEAEVHDLLTAISGIGPWSADVFILFCLGRADGFAAGDLALQVAAQHAFELDARPDAAELIELAERWRPWRGVAARLLWSYYRVVKAQQSGAPL